MKKKTFVRVGLSVILAELVILGSLQARAEEKIQAAPRPVEIVIEQEAPETEAPETQPETTGAPETEAPAEILLGNFLLTAYCDCSKCNGPNPGIDCFGGKLKDGTIAVDPKVIPLGSKVKIRGKVYTARDTGGDWVQGNHIDIYMKGHSNAIRFGEQYADVYLVK